MVFILLTMHNTHFAIAQNINHIKLSSDKVENSAKFKSGNDYQKDVLLFVDMLSTTHPAFGRGVKAPLKIDSLQNAAYKWAKNINSE